VSNEQHLHGVNYNRGSTGSLPEDIGDTKKKRQRQKHVQHWQQFTRAQYQAIDSRKKNWMPTNQISSMSARAHVFRERRARALQLSGVYKESRVAFRATRVRVS